MRIFDVIKLSLQNLLRTKFRSFLTILGVVIGISAIVLFVSLGLGLQQITSNQIATIDVLTTLTVNQKPETSSMDAGPVIDNATVESIKKMKNVEKVSATVNTPVNVEFKDTTTGAMAYGVKTENISLETANIIFGQALKNDNEAVISSMLANSFDEDHNNLIGKNFKIKILKDVDGIDYKAEELEIKVAGVDDNNSANFIFLPIDRINKFLDKRDNYSSIKVKVTSRKDIDNTKAKIEDMGYQVTTVKDLIDQIDNVFLIIQVILALVGGIGLLVSCLGIINIMIISLLERTHEIGIMKALGARDKDIKRLFFTESALIGFIGGAVGVLVAIAIGGLVNTLINQFVGDAEQIKLFLVPLKFSIMMIVFSSVIATFAGVYPAIRAKKLSPMDALRF